MLDDGATIAEYPSDDDLLSSEDSDSDSDDEGVSGRRRTPEERQRQEVARAKIAEYYHGSYFHTSIATLCYDIAEQLDKNDMEMLWYCTIVVFCSTSYSYYCSCINRCGIVGLTDQYVHQRIVESMYQKEVDRYMNVVMGFDAPSGENESPDTGTTEHENQVKICEDGAISFVSREYSFCLFRHWCLFESMFHTRRVAAKLETWTERGRDKLHMILAKLGIPLKESNTSYAFMEMECKNRLFSQILQYAQEFGLDESDIFYASFTRVMKMYAYMYVRDSNSGSLLFF